MIITVTLNAAIDKSLSVPNFRLGRRHRTVEQTTMPGGKGVNVARTLKTLGQPVIATGFAGGATGTRIVEPLTEESILNDFVRIREESRTNTAVLDPTNGQQTENNERGPAVTPKEVELFRDKLLYLARGADVVDGPLPARARVGTVEVRWRGDVVARVPLVTRTAVGSAGLLDRADDLAGRTLLVFLLAGVALGSLHLALLRRRARRRRALQRGGTEVA